MREVPRVCNRCRRVMFSFSAFLFVIRFQLRVVALRNGRGDEQRTTQIRRTALGDRCVARETLAALLHFGIESRVCNKLLAASESHRISDLRDDDRRKLASDTDDAFGKRTL